jgi:DNA-binding IclR family transcriptional regulator
MRLQDIFRTSAAKLLDLLLENPGRLYYQDDLARHLGADKGTVRRTLNHLTALRIVDVDTRFRIKVISLNTESDAGKALEAFHARLRPVQS